MDATIFELIGTPGTDIDQLQATPNISTWSATSIETYNRNLALIAGKELGGRVGPEGNSIRTGIFVDSFDADHAYISWGLFEDLIINSQFGFGSNDDDVQKGNNFQIRMDSSNSFTRYNKTHLDKQYILFRVPEDPAKFLYPDWWGMSDPYEMGEINIESPKAGSYTFQQGKWPKMEYIENIENMNQPVSEENFGDVDIEFQRQAIMEGYTWDYETYEKHSAIYRIGKVTTPTQVIHGSNDLRVPFTQGQEFYVALKRRGIDTEMVVYPRTPHGPREPKLLMDVSPRIMAWLDKYIDVR